MVVEAVMIIFQTASTTPSTVTATFPYFSYTEKGEKEIENITKTKPRKTTEKKQVTTVSDP